MVKLFRYVGAAGAILLILYIWIGFLSIATRPIPSDHGITHSKDQVLNGYLLMYVIPYTLASLLLIVPYAKIHNIYAWGMLFILEIVFGLCVLYSVSLPLINGDGSIRFSSITNASVVSFGLFALFFLTQWFAIGFERFKQKPALY